ncbi:MAG: site-specific integrase [Deltaproteobacteria bacterium]|nr:site-specific integrase [Deltaproteobacteria bacterium]
MSAHKSEKGQKGRVKLTKRYIDAAKYEGDASRNEEDVRWDLEVRGFGLRIYPSGTKTFIIRYRQNGRRKGYTVGTFGVLTVDQARDDARKLLGLVKRDGADPSGDKKREAHGETVADMAKAFFELYAEPRLKPRTVKEYRRQYTTHIEKRWGSRLARSIRRPEVVGLHADLGAKIPTQANRTLMMLCSLFSFGLEHGYLPEGASNPAHGIEKFPERERDRWVRAGELPQLIEAIDAEPNIYVRAAFWMYLLVGARKSELLAAKWADVDFERQELRFPDTATKSGTTHYVPLSEAAMAVLSTIPRLDGNPFIFVGRGPRRRRKTDPPLPVPRPPTHLVNINKPWTAIRDRAALAVWREDPRLSAVVEQVKDDGFRERVRCAAAKKRRPLTDDEQETLRRDPTSREVREAASVDLPTAQLDVWIHDLRRTVGSWLATHGESLPLIGKVLNHQDTKTTSIYSRLAEDPIRRALEEHGQRIMGTAKKIRVLEGGK